MKKSSLSFVAILALPAVLSACGKGNKAGVDCPDLSGDWTGDMSSIDTITQNGCESITGKLISGETVTLSTSDIDVKGIKGRAEFFKDKIEITLTETFPSGPEFGDLAGKSVIKRGIFTKPSNDEIQIEVSVEGPESIKTLLTQRLDPKVVLRRAKPVAAPLTTEAPQAKETVVNPTGIEAVEQSVNNLEQSRKELQVLQKRLEDTEQTLSENDRNQIEKSIKELEEAMKTITNPSAEANPVLPGGGQ